MAGIEIPVVTFELLGLVERPVVVEVAAGPQGAKAEDGLGTGEAPARAGKIHAIFDEVSTGALDHAGGE